MYYKIIEKFGPQNIDRWRSYLAWRGLNLTCFDSVDGILRPDLFEPKSREDWDNCVREDFKLGLISNLDYAKKVLEKTSHSALVGVEIELDENYSPQDGLLGFDILERECQISILTNWGSDEEGLINSHVMPNGLVGERCCSAVTAAGSISQSETIEVLLDVICHGLSALSR